MTMRRSLLALPCGSGEGWQSSRRHRPPFQRPRAIALAETDPLDPD
jgi:hypothetical protein